MKNVATFGDPERFEIAIGWVDDPEPRERRPAHGGWSTGELRLSVGAQVLTRHQHGSESIESVRWYLLPVFEWLAEHWVSLLHEERFAWHENSAAPAATAAFLALRRMIGADDDAGRAAYAKIQGWWARHALRAADASALYPDVVFRRFGDEVEVSWTARQPVHAPDGFQFALTPGAATLPIADVAEPLWEALAWVVGTACVLNRDDSKSVANLEQRIAELAHLPTADLEAGYLPTKLFDRVTIARQKQCINDTSKRMSSVPALTRLDDAVLMFGGASPEIGIRDIHTLTAFLGSHVGGVESAELSALVDPEVGAPLTAPFEEGYDLAERLLEERKLPGNAQSVDVRSLLSSLSVTVVVHELRTSTIRGVALAGLGYGPAILVNLTSNYNKTEEGRRFTLAHELFHILYDRARAKRIAHTSGPWAPQGIEKRANAFAAMLLMPRDLVRRSTSGGKLTQQNVLAAARSMEVGVSALVEHLYNVGMINDFERDDLRTAFGRSL